MKHFKLTFLLTIVLSMMACHAVAYDAWIDGIYYNFNGAKAEVTYLERLTDNKTAYQGPVVIPSTLTYNGKNYKVTSIGYRAFFACSDLTSINIPESVTSIGSQAFFGCSGLTSINIPESVTSIGEDAFVWCI